MDVKNVNFIPGPLLGLISNNSKDKVYMLSQDSIN